MKLNTENCCDKASAILALDLKGIKYCPWCGREVIIKRKKE